MSNKATLEYLRMNRKVHNLPCAKIEGTPKKLDRKSLTKLFVNKIFNLKGILVYFFEISIGIKWMWNLKTLKSSKVQNRSIIIGNGPSQGYLTNEILQGLKDNKLDIIVVNYWNENVSLSSVVPTYLVISDPHTLSENAPSRLQDRNTALRKYLLENPTITLICPIRRCKELSTIFNKERLIGIVDSDLQYWSSNITPIRPRGYISMTLYKALAIAKWFDYEKIYVLGMDNTYPRNIFCNIDNKFINLEQHAGGDEYTVDQSKIYPNIGVGLLEISDLYFDSYKFNSDSIYNLDPYSLTDSFKKINAFSSDNETNISLNKIIR
jgi:hypothetical protein